MAYQAPEPTQVPWVSPYVTVKDVDSAVSFYQSAFHFEVKNLSPGEDKTTWHAELTYQGQLLMFGKAGAWGGTTESPASSGVACPITLYVYTDNVDEFYQHAIKHKAEGVMPPDDMFWGDRMCQLKDPDGYIWCVATRGADHR